MDNSAISWFSELGMENALLSDQCHNMDYFDEDLSAAFGDDFQSSLSPEGSSPSCISTIIPRSSSTTSLCVSSFMEAPPIVTERPAKQHKRNDYNFSNIRKRSAFDQAASSPIILTFGNPDTLEINPQQVSLGTLYPEDDAWCEVLTSNGSFVNLVEATKTTVQTKEKKPGGRPPSKTYDHIVAERKRREQLSQRFMALSAIVPGLKKMDKTSVLGDAIGYLKHLQERVKTLEEQATKQTVESVVLVKKSQLPVEDEGSSSDEMDSTDDQRPLPEIEAKVCDKKVLLRIHSENQRGLLIKILSEVEKLNLAVINTSVLQFGSLALDITIIAEMGKEFHLTTKELAKSLQSALQLLKQEA